MPELPEVETIRCELEPLISGKIFAAPVIHIPTTIAYPEPERFAAQLSGRIVSGVSRKGKYLLINLDCGILVVHLRMTGNLIYIDEKDLPQSDRFLRLELPFTDGSALHYSDMRRFGRLWLVECAEQLQDIVLKNIGPDIYNDLNALSFSELLQSRGKRGLKALLLDQGFAAGMGNIYTDECLHRCGFHPERRASTLSEAEVAELYRVIIEVLDAGIKHGGTTFRDYRNARGALGDFQSKLAVYGRKGEYCQCGTAIEKTVVAGRGTYFCPCCQVVESEPEGVK
jgi:formamidopyrimidine-DNA glycosylase